MTKGSTPVRRRRVVPEVSVILATRNHEAFLPQCVESLLKQTLPRSQYEVVVVNDDSTDGTAHVLARYGRALVTVQLPQHAGLARACNEGLHRARGEFVMRVDSDDWLEPDALEQAVAAMRQHPETDILLADYWAERPRGRARIQMDARNVFSWTAAGVLMRTRMLRDAGGYRPLFWEESDLYLRLLSRGARAMRLARPLWHYRKHAAGMTASRTARTAGWQELLRAWPTATLQRFGSHQELAAALAQAGGR